MVFSIYFFSANALFGHDELFFFTPRDRKYPTGLCPKGEEGLDFGKGIGTDKSILTLGGLQCLGVKKGLVFHKSRPPKGEKTCWVMDEYRLLDDTHSLPTLRGSMRVSS